jgi:hypothetical protein
MNTTAEEFISYWLSNDGDEMSQYEALCEWIHEAEAQYHSECAMFGDAGPGQGYRLNAAKRELSTVTARLKRLGALRPAIKEMHS